jgi:hypothetical protein
MVQNYLQSKYPGIEELDQKANASGIPIAAVHSLP